MVEMLKRVIKDNSFYRPKTVFNGIDFISEFLYNRNEKCPERQLNWTYIFDMDWVQTFLAAKYIKWVIECTLFKIIKGTLIGVSTF